jgi:hypothetical protein
LLTRANWYIYIYIYVVWEKLYFSELMRLSDQITSVYTIMSSNYYRIGEMYGSY